MASSFPLAGLCRIKHQWRPVVTRTRWLNPKSLLALRNRSGGKGHDSCDRRMRGGGAVQRGCASRKLITNQQQQEAAASRRHTMSNCRVNGPASPRRPRAETLTLTRRRRELPSTAAHRLRQLCHAAQPGSKPCPMVGAPGAEAPLHALKSSGESSLDEAESTADDMSDDEDARQARPSGRRPLGGTPLVPCKRVPSGSP